MVEQYPVIVHLYTVDNKTKAHLALLATNLFYGAGYSTAKYLMPRLIEPLGFILIRVSVAATLFWISYLLGDKFRAKISRRDWGILALGGLFGVAANQMLFFLGLNHTMPIHASLVMMSTPLLIMVIALIVLKERITKSKLLGLLLGIAGALLLMSAGKELTGGTNTAWGDFLVFLNATSYAIYLVIIKPLMQRYRPLVVIRWVFLFGLIYVLPFGWGEFSEIQWNLFDTKDYLALGFTVICVTYLAYLWNIYALSQLSASTAGAYIYLQPFFAGIISVIFMNEQVTVIKIIAAILIFAGVYLVNFGFGKMKTKEVENV